MTHIPESVFLKKIPLSELKKGMIVSKLDKPGIHFPFYGQVLEELDFVAELRSSGVSEVYISVKDDGKNLEHGSENISLSTTPPCRKSTPFPETGYESVRPGAFTPGSNLVFAQKIRTRANRIVKNIFTGIAEGKLPDVNEIKVVVDEFVSTCLYKNEVLINMLIIREDIECEINHAINVSILSIALGRRLGLPTSELENLGIAGLFHDIGMLTLPESVYREPDDMTDDDLELLKTHPEKSYILLKKAGGLNDTVLQAVLQHHERANGTGYPEGLLERQITKNAKLLAIADTYDTLTSDRPYSKSRTPIQAIKMIFSWSGKHFNETLVKFFVSLVGVYPVGTLLKLKSGEIGIVYEITKGNSSKPKILVIFDEQENEVFPFSIDLNEKNIRTGGYVKEIEKTLTPEDITIDIFAVLEKHFIGRN